MAPYRSLGATALGASCSPIPRPSRPTIIGKLVNNRRLIPIAIVLLAASWRFLLLKTALANVDGDQAVAGLMAQNIQAGEHPLLFYGQPYSGSIESYAAALCFNIFGSSDLALRLPAMAMSIAFVSLIYSLAKALYGPVIALLSGLYLSIGPDLLTNWSMAAGANYIDVMVCGTLLLLLASRYPDLDRLPYPMALLCGLLAGLGLWLQPMIGEYLLPLILTYASRLILRHQYIKWSAVARSLCCVAIGAIAGSTPLLIYNVRHNLATLGYLWRFGVGGDHLAVAGQMIGQSLPIVLGMAIPSTEMDDRVAFAHRVGEYCGFYVLGLLVGLGILVRLFQIAWTGWLVLTARDSHQFLRGKIPGSKQTLALVGVSCVMFFMFSQFGAKDYGTVPATSRPCYLLPLYTIVPLLFNLMIVKQVTGIVRYAVPGGIVVILIVANIAMTFAAPVRPSINDLTMILHRHHIRVAYVNDYWLAYRISFETQQNIRGIGVTDNLHLGLIRTPGDLQVAATVPANQVAWIFIADRPAGELNFRTLLRRREIHARRTRWANGVFYDLLSQPLRPRRHSAPT